MNIKKLYNLQKELDAHIKTNHQLQNDNLVDKKILALLVEIGELANETRCFKFWSLKPTAPKAKIIEEFVDGIHFILSLGIECGFENNELEIHNSQTGDMTDQFLKVFECVSKFKNTPSFIYYEQLFSEYLSLGLQLGFSHHDIEDAYLQKNEVNFERQENGY
jgi:dimeric dUTPase (all-alpha-NTP-PPase superfamily)